MTRTSLFSAVLVVLISPAALRGDDQKPAGDKTPRLSAEMKAQGKATGAPASPDQLKGLLGEALKLIQSLAENASKTEGELRLPTPGMFKMELSKESPVRFRQGDRTSTGRDRRQGGSEDCIAGGHRRRG